MTVKTVDGSSINQSLLPKYLKSLIDKFFKILPMREASEATLSTYMCSLRVELLGLGGLIPDLGENTLYLTLLSILQYLINNIDEPVEVVRREVFRAINLCSRMEVYYRCKVVEDANQKAGDRD